MENTSVDDPGDFSVPKVLAYAEANPSEIPRLRAAEAAGKGRSTLLSGLDDILVPSGEPADEADDEANDGENVEAAGDEPEDEPEDEDEDDEVDDADAFTPLSLGDSDYAPGVTGSRVADLQRKLSAVMPTGRFGVSTVRAVKRLQAEHGLEVTGVFDAATAEVLD